MVTKLCNGLHQLRIDFQVTPVIRRSAYIYLIEGASCYLVDSGVGESEKAIFSYMEGIGRKPEEIKGIFLTHAHPDHIGSAARIKELTGGSQRERRWIEDIDLQFRERPIPNFHALARRPCLPETPFPPGTTFPFTSAWIGASPPCAAC